MLKRKDSGNKEIEVEEKKFREKRWEDSRNKGIDEGKFEFK